MHGLGNDFVVIDAISQKINLSTEDILFLADRHFGIGFDQLLLVEKSDVVDFKYRIFNSDGGEVEQCGNGARCFAVFVREKGLTDKDSIRVETASGIIELHIQPDGQVCVDMGVPDLSIEDAVNAGVRSLVIGVAPVGGTIPQKWWDVIEEATRHGLDIVCGLHVKLKDNPLIVDAAGKSGSRLIDVRVPHALH